MGSGRGGHMFGGDDTGPTKPAGAALPPTSSAFRRGVRGRRGLAASALGTSTSAGAAAAALVLFERGLGASR
ncbi:MAG: hypothetical protein LW840_14080 [Gemmatimonas sp.]|uniref:hypothetical protein n=1 Tax=Gemmatimonas sp. TaxID=1962908 RepID=UPI0025B8DD96|nr:hypothetical protein [Gemmatimonas sp.]MCE2954822.1 hypothetical protein [Gemmatimonas sp.]